MDSVIRTWDLPTSHLINAFRTESPCTALAFSDTGEYLATAHADGVGINLWNNRTLFAHVPTRMIRDDEIIETTLPTSSGEGGQGLLDTALEEDAKDEYEDNEDTAIQDTPSTIDAISKDLLSLSLVPKSRWQNLLHLQAIKARNKPTEPPKAPEKAPFFLPSLTNTEQPNAPTVNGTAPPNQVAQPNGNATTSSLSRISRPSLSSTTRSQFTTLLHTFNTYSQRQEYESDPDPAPLLTHLSTLGPSAADAEIRSLANLDEMIAFIKALTARLRQKRDFELVQTWMSVFLKCHGGEIVGEGNVGGEGRAELGEALKAWREESGREGKRLGELVGYCSGVLGWLRSAR